MKSLSRRCPGTVNGRTRAVDAHIELGRPSDRCLRLASPSLISNPRASARRTSPAGSRSRADPRSGRVDRGAAGPFAVGVGDRDEAEAGGGAHLGQGVRARRRTPWLKLSEPPLLRVDHVVADERPSRSCARSCTLIDAANTMAPVTRATPISTGAAVRAVRFGLRCTLPRAIAPVMPRQRCTGAPEHAGDRLGHHRAEQQHRRRTASAMPTPSRIPSAPTSTATIVPTPSAAQRSRRSPARAPNRALERASRSSPPRAVPGRRRSPARSRRSGWRRCRRRS